MRNETKDITTNFIDTKRMIREFYEQLYACKVDNLDKITNFWKQIMKVDS